MKYAKLQRRHVEKKHTYFHSLHITCFFISIIYYHPPGYSQFDQMRAVVFYDISLYAHSNCVSVWVASHSVIWLGHYLTHLMSWIHCTLPPLPCKCTIYFYVY